MSHLTIAASENAFVELFKLARDGFTLSKSDSASFGPSRRATRSRCT